MHRTPVAGTVLKALEVLDQVGRSGAAPTASDVSAEVGLPFSTAFRLLTTLVHARYLDVDPKTGQYSLGLKCLELGLRAQRSQLLTRTATPVMQALVDEVKETAHLTVRDGTEGLFIAEVESDRTVRVRSLLGQRAPLYAGASMKILLAYAPPDLVEEVLSQFTRAVKKRKNLPDVYALREQLIQIRRTEVSTSISEQNDDAAGVSAPVRDYSSAVVAGLCISGPANRFTTDRMPILKNAVQRKASEISARLGFQR